MTATTTTETDAASTDASLAWGTTSFDPGGDVALVARDTVGLIERDNPSTRARLWGLVADEAPLDDILDELSSTGLKALPDFGLAQVEGTAIRVVARGRAKISVVLGSGSTHEIDPSDVRTWIEELVEDAAAITITLSALDGDAPAETDEAFAILAGSVPARSLTRWYDAADDHAESAESGAGWTAGGTDSGRNDAPSDDEKQLEPAPDVELAMVADIEEPESGSDDSWFDDQAGDSATIIPPQPMVETDDAEDPEPDGSKADGPESDDSEPVDSESADPESADPGFADARPSEWEPSGSLSFGAKPVDAQPASPQPPPPGAQVSDQPPSGPGAGGAPPSTSSPDPTVVVGSEDGPARGPASSIFDTDLDAELGDDFDDHAAGSVPGDVANPLIDTPVYGVLVFSNGERIDVDRSILIGRNPKVAGGADGGLPRIMKFDGPGQGLSRTHAEVRIEAGEVYVEDLQSTNGTEVQLPGQQRRRLRGGEPVAIVPGTLIDFGDELHCTLESAS